MKGEGTAQRPRGAAGRDSEAVPGKNKAALRRAVVVREAAVTGSATEEVCGVGLVCWVQSNFFASTTKVRGCCVGSLPPPWEDSCRRGSIYTWV